jgi:hypothetical protein
MTFSCLVYGGIEKGKWLGKGGPENVGKTINPARRDGEKHSLK